MTWYSLDVYELDNGQRGEHPVVPNYRSSSLPDGSDDLDG